MEFFAYVGRNWVHIVVILSLIMVVIDLHLFRRRMTHYDHELKATREIIRDIENEVVRGIEKIATKK